MRLLGRSLFLATMMASLIASSALAARPIGGCPAGPRETGTADISGWELMTEAAVEGAALAAGAPPGTASAEFAKVNKNDDLVVCVMKQVLPNDASGSTTWFVFQDNTSQRP